MSIPAGLLGFPENIGPKAAVELKFSFGVLRGLLDR